MGDKILEVDGNVDVMRRSFGNKWGISLCDFKVFSSLPHRIVSGRVTAFLRNSSFEPFLVELQRVWMPLVYAMFPTEQFYGGKPVEQLRNVKGKLFNWNEDYERDEDDEEESSRNHCDVDSIPTPR